MKYDQDVSRSITSMFPWWLFITINVTEHKVPQAQGCLPTNYCALNFLPEVCNAKHTDIFSSNFFLSGKYNFMYTEHQLFFLPEKSNAICELAK